MKRTPLFYCVAALGCCLSWQELEAQVASPLYPSSVNWGVYDPYYVVTSRVYGQAALIHAQGDAAVGFAHARNLRAEAYSKELDNWVKEVRSYWDRKIVREKKRLAMDDLRHIKQMSYLNDRKWRNNRSWDLLKNHRGLSEARIKSGSAHNFLLDRLSSSPLLYRFDPETSPFGAEALNELRLDDRMLASIMLKQGPFKFAANESVQEQIRLWPYLLRREEFDSARTAFEEARADVLVESEIPGPVPVAKIMKMQTTLLKLANEFFGSSARSWAEKHHRYAQFYSADRFLRELDREIVGLEKTGDIRPLRGAQYDPATDGANVVSLLSFMNHNGLEFAPPQPGCAPDYHRLFVMMRALYLTVADHDAGVEGENLGDLAK